MIFLLCDGEGDVIEVVRASSFEEAYEDTVRSNKGQILVELDYRTLDDIWVASKLDVEDSK